MSILMMTKEQENLSSQQDGLKPFSAVENLSQIRLHLQHCHEHILTQNIYNINYNL